MHSPLELVGWHPSCVNCHANCHSTLLLAHHTLADTPHHVCPLWSQHSWSLALPRMLFIGVGEVLVGLSIPGLISISHESCQLLAGLSTALTFPYLRKATCALRSATPQRVGLAPEQLASVTDHSSVTLVSARLFLSFFFLFPSVIPPGKQFSFS